MGRDTRKPPRGPRGSIQNQQRQRTAARRATPGELQRIDAERALRAAVKRERAIQKSARQLERLTNQSTLALMQLARHIVEPDFKIVPATAESAAGVL